MVILFNLRFHFNHNLSNCIVESVNIAQKSVVWFRQLAVLSVYKINFHWANLRTRFWMIDIRARWQKNIAS